MNPNRWLGSAFVVVVVTLVVTAAPTAADSAKRGRVALTSKDFSATGTAGKPAVVNFKLDEGHHRMADIVVSCFAQIDNHDVSALLSTSKAASSSSSSAHDNSADACAGAEVFLRISPGMSPHVAFTIVNDDGPIMSAPSRDGWNGITSHGVSKRCTKYSFDECSVSRDFTYTTSYKDLAEPAEHGMWYAATTPTTAAASNASSNNGTNTKTTLETATRHGFALVDSVPADVDFDSRMAGTMYRINTVARHLLIEFKTPPELAAEGAYLQLEVRLTGTTSGQTMLVGLLCIIIFFTVLGNTLISVRKYALRTRPIHMHLTPREVWSLRRGPGPAGAPGLPIVPDMALPEIVGKPVTPSRLEPKRRHAQQADHAAAATGGAAEDVVPATADSREPESDGAATTSTELAAIPMVTTASAAQPAADADDRADTVAAEDLPTVQPGADFSALVARLRSTMTAAAPGGARAVPIPTADDADDDEELLEGDAAETRALAPKSSSSCNGAASDAGSNGDDDNQPSPAPAAASPPAPPSPQPPRAPLPPGAVTVTIPDSNSDSDDLACRICQDASPRNELFAPCACAGSSKYVHKTCLEQWRYSTNNAQHRGACAECKTKYTTKEELERQQQQQQHTDGTTAAPTSSSRLAAYPRVRCCFRCAGSMGPPIYTAVLVMLFGGYAVKFGAFIVTGFDSGVEWVPNAYHFMLGAALILSEILTVAQLSHYFSGYPVRNARVVLFVLGYVLPFAFGYVAMFFVWMIEVTLLRPEVSYISGVVCAFACSQYFLPTLNEAVARAEIEAWFHGAGGGDNAAEGVDEQALRDALARAVRDAHREAQRQHQEQQQQHQGQGQAAPAAADAEHADTNGSGGNDDDAATTASSSAPAAPAVEQPDDDERAPGATFAAAPEAVGEEETH